MTFQIACIQNCASADMVTSLDEASELTQQARQAGADLICLPEFFSCLSVSGQQFEVGAHPEQTHPALTHFSAIARKFEAWIQLGSLAIRCESGKIRNRCLMLDPRGQITARYDKIHLFDVRVPDAVEAERVGAAIQGLEPVTQGVSLEVSGGVERKPLERIMVVDR